LADLGAAAAADRSGDFGRLGARPGAEVLVAKAVGVALEVHQGNAGPYCLTVGAGGWRVRLDYLRSLFRAFTDDEDNIEVRSLLFYSLWIGGHFIAADHGLRSRADIVKAALSWLQT
jgi:hypothetical protein